MENHLQSKIAKAIFHKRTEVDAWLNKQFCTFTEQGVPPPFYSSVDIRDSGFKVAPVDCNLFPAGFNNICEDDLQNAPKLIQKEIKNISAITQSPVKKILLIPESHTKNKNYLENIYTLKTILEKSGLEIELGWYDPLDTPSIELTSATEKQLTFHALSALDHFSPDWILLNNDFSSGYPEKLKTFQQPIFPDPRLGWHQRTKSHHFKFYNHFATQFAELIGIDPWLITIDSQAITQVNFSTGENIDQVYTQAKQMLTQIQLDYQKRGISEKPALYIKNDSGTYGIGIMVIHDAEEIKTMNRRAKNKMSVGKGHSEIHQVILQEGIPTRILSEGKTAEPVIYLVGTELLGGFVRVNSERDSIDNLNSPGMIFKKFCFKDLHDCWNNSDLSDFPTLEAVYGSVAKLSALAATQEHFDLLYK